MAGACCCTGRLWTRLDMVKTVPPTRVEETVTTLSNHVQGAWRICRPCPVGGAALVRVGHTDRCPSCGAVLREPGAGELDGWASL
jgi:hypothetical protein